ncbi:hypothetical protein BB560_002380 [Smittium megazygosporum]|uniref:Cyclin N-terminal domain-containing protein n=1 Tax=Smittium megazygosporum TaxID=133381 RepID=A0A2T9ZEX6_9FUNG|nr:hypothetical protein BB560_002380 [Smittium megazygosporum]
MVWKVSPRTYDLIRGPVTQEIIDDIATFTKGIIHQKERQHERRNTYDSSMLNDKAPEIHRRSGSVSFAPEPNELTPLNSFIKNLSVKSKVQTGTLICTLVYLSRLRKRLPKGAKGIPCTYHRIFLASLIIAGKYLNDASPKNKYWAKYSSMFSIAEVNLMEKQFLFLLDYDLRIDAEDLEFASNYFYKEKYYQIKEGDKLPFSSNLQNHDFQSPKITFSEPKSALCKSKLNANPLGASEKKYMNFSFQNLNPFSKQPLQQDRSNESNVKNQFPKNCVQIPPKTYYNPSHARSLSSIQFDKVKI